MSDTAICPGCNNSFATAAMDYTDRGLMCAACALDLAPTVEPGPSPLMLVGYTILSSVFTCSPPCISSRSANTTTMTIDGITATSRSLSVDPPGLMFALMALILTVNGLRLAAGARAPIPVRVLVGLWFAGLSLVAFGRLIFALPITLPF